MRDSMAHVRRAGVAVLRTAWIAWLLALISCISLITPRRDQATTVEQAEEILRRARQAPLRGTVLRRWLGASLGVTGDIPPLPLPDIDDIIVLAHGIPVVPWLKRVGTRQWQIWLDHIGRLLRLRYPDRADIAPGPAWSQWLADHVCYVETHFARIAGQRIAQLVSALPPGTGEIYIIGHSAGASAVLQYLADLREEVVPPPSRPIRAVLTLDAAVTGIARAWTGWPTAPEGPSSFDRFWPRIERYLRLDRPQPSWRRHIRWARDYVDPPFAGLGAWLRGQGIGILTVSNIADAFTHGALADLPYLSLRIGRRFDVRGMVTGKTHMCIQRDPRVLPVLLWHDDLALS
jgi:pimeloyl-ACP methyl ester carboxylesterase